MPDAVVLSSMFDIYRNSMFSCNHTTFLDSALHIISLVIKTLCCNRDARRLILVLGFIFANK